MRNLLSLGLLALLFWVILELSLHIELPFLSAEADQGCSLPTSTKEVAGRFGGSPEQWHKSDPMSWTYEGTAKLRYRVPDACQLGAKLAGDTVWIQPGYTITWEEDQEE